MIIGTCEKTRKLIGKEDKVILKYKSLVSKNIIADFYNVSTNVINRILRENNVPKNDHKEVMKKSWTDEKKKIHSKKLKKILNHPKVRSKFSKSMKEYWTDEKKKEHSKK